MSDQAPTHSFIVRQEVEGTPVEVWIDWSADIDQAPTNRVRAWRDGNDLLLQSQDATRSRRLSGIDAEDLQQLEQLGGVMVVCGVAGVLARRPFELSASE